MEKMKFIAKIGNKTIYSENETNIQKYRENAKIRRYIAKMENKKIYSEN